MKLGTWQTVVLLAVAAVVGSLSAVSANWLIAESNTPTGLHAFVHEELDLTPAQEQKLDRLEEAFAVEQRRLELELKSANAQLAQAMENEHRYGPEVGVAIDQVHTKMGDLQKATVAHVFAMRELLDRRQQAVFDHEVTSALTADPSD
jgi:Spy/CpxP family protein refolding chaperone